MEKQLALITGGSTGLGYGMARRFAARGYHVILIARSADKLAHAADSLKQLGASVEAFQADITDQAALNSVRKHIEQDRRQIHFLVLNAGTGYVNTLEDSDIAEMKNQIDINLWGTILSAKSFVPLLADHSRILFISSAFGLTAGAGYSAYCASKAGIINFALALRRELLGRVSVHVACPGDIDTPLYQQELKSLPAWLKAAKVRSTVLTSDVAADRILKKCSGNRFLVFTNFDIFVLLSVLPRILPTRWVLSLGDRLLPVPRSSN